MQVEACCMKYGQLIAIGKQNLVGEMTCNRVGGRKIGKEKRKRNRIVLALKVKTGRRALQVLQ
jgi:hypothetical protein